MTSTAIGLEGEQIAVQYLQVRGYEMVARNWRTKVCEIDIVARKHGTLHFIEVKYRGQDEQGSGLDYLTPRKLQRLWFAAQVFVKDSGWRGAVNIAGIEVSGATHEVTGFVESISYDY